LKVIFLDIQRNIPLKPLNTLMIDVNACYFASIDNATLIPDLIAYAQQRDLPVLILGGGSNIVLTHDYPGLVIQLNNKGIETTIEGDNVLLTAQAGENWHQLVMASLQNNYYGLENLALIPGNIGAAAIQNIGAYGIEFESVFERLTGWNINTKSWQTLQLSDCNFGYRNSIFKNGLKDKFVITEVTIKLSLIPRVDLKYQALSTALKSIKQPTPQDVAKTVIKIRSNKLPAPERLPNAGSFFKNPVVTEETLHTIKAKHPGIVYYSLDNRQVKLAAGWLIEQLGWKGKTINNVSMHEQQALVLINQGGSGTQVIAYAESVKADVFKHFNVLLDIEPRVY
jgi:UDP-N-acetylmuramate dehydrogenase